MKLWLFNPENDIALATGTANFTPPPAAVEMRRAGELLPFFLAENDDSVVCNGINAGWFDDFRNQFDIEAYLWNHSCDDFTPCPWGWSKYARRLFENLGFRKDILPSDATLDRWRNLSHRHTAACVGDYLSELSSLDIWPRAKEAENLETLRELLREGYTVVKQPWSSSGRGVRFFDAEKMSMDAFMEQTAGTIRRQGSVMAERFMPDHKDFALLYKCKGGDVEYVGPSVFAADAQGRYEGNVVAQDEYLYNNIEIPKMAELITCLSDALRAVVAPAYEGPVGVDLCYADGMIHVCETNLRYTMGFVARGIARHIPEAPPSIISVSANCESSPLYWLSPPDSKMRFYLKLKR